MSTAFLLSCRMVNHDKDDLGCNQYIQTCNTHFMY